MKRSPEELEILFAKFDRDVEVYPRWFRLLMATDQWFSVLIWNSSQDETISSHMYRRIQNGKSFWIERVICKLLRKIETSHCFKSRGE